MRLYWISFFCISIRPITSCKNTFNINKRNAPETHRLTELQRQEIQFLVSFLHFFGSLPASLPLSGGLTDHVEAIWRC